MSVCVSANARGRLSRSGAPVWVFPFGLRFPGMFRSSLFLPLAVCRFSSVKLVASRAVGGKKTPPDRERNCGRLHCRGMRFRRVKTALKQLLERRLCSSFIKGAIKATRATFLHSKDCTDGITKCAKFNGNCVCFDDG